MKMVAAEFRFLVISSFVVVLAKIRCHRKYLLQRAQRGVFTRLLMKEIVALLCFFTGPARPAHLVRVRV